MPPSIRFAILTVSDSCYNGSRVDGAGPALKELITLQIPNSLVASSACVPDDISKIQDALRKWTDSGVCDVALTTGGTGFAPSDITPEATAALLHKRCDVFAAATALKSSSNFAILSRAIAGIRNNTLIVNLPGSVKGATESLSILIPVLPHAVHLIRDDKILVDLHHSHLSQKSKVKVSDVANRPRESQWPMLEVKEAYKLVMDHVIDQREEQVSLLDSLGRILSQDVISKDPLPPFRASVMDGYAVIAADGCGPRRVVGASSAGSVVDIQLKSMECVRVNTGSCLPDNADAVVQVEQTRLITSDFSNTQELEIEILKSAVVGQNIRNVGCDIARNAVVLKKGCVVRSSDIGLLAACQVTRVPTFRLPRVCVVSTGDELVEYTESLAPGKIRDTNRWTLISLLRENGFQVTDGGIIKDDPDVIYGRMKKLLEDQDVIITTGGVSMGDKDYLKQVLEQDLNFKILFGRINMKPGKPTTFAVGEVAGQALRKLVFSLPGNPVSAFVTCHLFVLPSLRISAGFQLYTSPVVPVVVDEDHKLDERPEFKRVFVYTVPGKDATFTTRASSTGVQASSRLLSCHRASGLLVLPSSKSGTSLVKSGSLVDAMIIDSTTLLQPSISLSGIQL